FICRRDATHCLSSEVSLSEAGAVSNWRGMGANALDEADRTRRSEPPLRRELLLAYTCTRPCSDRDQTERSLHLRRRRSQHAPWRVLDFRYVAHSPRDQ